MTVKEAKRGDIVCFGGEWGVLEGRVLDRWRGGRIELAREEVVSVLPRRKKG